MKRKPIRRRRTKSCNVATSYPKHKYKLGDKVIIKSSTYSGISPGEEGIVDGLLKQGYAVKFTKTWPATFINEKPPFATRILFFAHDEVE